MFCRVVYTAKIGKDRDTREIGMALNARGELRLQFDVDVDWSEPIFVIIEPAEQPLGVSPLLQDSNPPPDYGATQKPITSTTDNPMLEETKKCT